MKKLLLLLLIIALCTQLFSCNNDNLPLTSDNFSQDFVNSFFDNYRLVDPQLAYVTASPWEVEIKIDNDEMLYLSLIDDVDKGHFVSVTEQIKFYMGAPGYRVCVYQTSAAPTPMEDWTIKSIRVLEVVPFRDNKNDVILRSENYMENMLTSSTVLHTYDNNNDSDFFDTVKDAYSMAETAELFSSSVTYMTKATEYTSHQYSLLIEFNESNNIIWHSYLLKDSDNIYFECTTYDAEDVERENFSLAKIDDRYAEQILDLIDPSHRADLAEVTS